MKAHNKFPKEWFPDFFYSNNVKVILHWTGGSYHCGELEKSHYHFIVDGNGDVIPGYSKPGEPAPHTYGFNWEIGVSICCMHNAQSGFNHGKYPMKKIQWEVAIALITNIVERYKIPVTKNRVLTHAEVTSVLGVDQWGKWDITELSFDRTIKNPSNDLRTRILDTGTMQETTVGRKVIFDNGLDFIGVLTNSSVMLGLRKLEAAKVLTINRVYNNTNGVLTASICNFDSPITHEVPLQLINEVGFIGVKTLEKLGYSVVYNNETKTVEVCRKTGETQPATS